MVVFSGFPHEISGPLCTFDAQVQITIMVHLRSKFQGPLDHPKQIHEENHQNGHMMSYAHDEQEHQVPYVCWKHNKQIQ